MKIKKVCNNANAMTTTDNGQILNLKKSHFFNVICGEKKSQTLGIDLTYFHFPTEITITVLTLSSNL